MHRRAKALILALLLSLVVVVVPMQAEELQDKEPTSLIHLSEWVNSVAGSIAEWVESMMITSLAAHHPGGTESTTSPEPQAEEHGEAPTEEGHTPTTNDFGGHADPIG